MNRFSLLVPLAVLALCVSTALSSCTSARVDQAALFEPARIAWPAVRSDFERGITEVSLAGGISDSGAEQMRAKSDDMGSALDSSDRTALRLIAWPAMAPIASFGIDSKLNAGEIGPGVASSLREQLVNFTATISRLRGQ